MNRPDRFKLWIFWLQEDKSLGITHNNFIRWTDRFGREYKHNWKIFCRKLNRSFNEKYIRHLLRDYRFFGEDQPSALQILNIRNAEIKSHFINDYGRGFKQFLKDLKASIVHAERGSKLIRIFPGGNEEPLTYIVVKDVSTQKKYILRVPPEVKNCKEAIAWTFGMSEEEYNLTAES